MPTKQGDVALLNDPVAKELLQSTLHVGPNSTFAQDARKMLVLLNN